jgi:hypothetical protein
MGMFLKERELVIIGEAHRAFASPAREATYGLKPSAIFYSSAAAMGAVKR